MHYQLNIKLTDEDYLAFNVFHNLESKDGKKMVIKGRMIFSGMILLLSAAYLLLKGWGIESVIYLALVIIISAIYLVRYKKGMIRSMRNHINRLKKKGKLPFDPESTLEFYEDRFVEITPTCRSERDYHILERICVLKDRYLLLYNSSIGAYILPIPQIKKQTNLQEFLDFIMSKCSTVEHY